MRNNSKIDKSNVEDIIPLTPMQEGMLFHYLMDPKSQYYCEQLSLKISGEIDTRCFEKAWNFVIETNEMLRTVFRWEKVGNPIQIILKSFSPKVNYLVENNKIICNSGNFSEQVKMKDREKKFHLEEVPFRVTLCKLEEAKHEMIISNHHILYDGWSNGIILKEFFNAYHTFWVSKSLSTRKGLVKPVKTKFKEFVQWIKKRDIKKEENFWKNYLKGIDTQAGIPIKSKVKGKGIRTASAKNYQISFERYVKDKLENFIKVRGITLASFFYSAWGILLQKYNNTDDVVFGTTVSGRSAKVKGIEDMVGLFINTLPTRIQTGSKETAGDLLLRIDGALHMRQAYEHSSLVDIKYSENDNNEDFFDLIVIMENYPLDSGLIPAGSHLSIDSYVMKEVSHYDLTITIKIFDDIEVNAAYREDLFEDKSVVRLFDHFSCVVETMMENPGKLVAEIEIISQEEKKELLFDFNDTEVVYPAEKRIHELFEDQVEQRPDNTAAVGPLPVKYRTYMTYMTYISYRELNEKSNQLARLLIKKGVKPGTIVAIMLERSIDMIIAILGILKTGAAYLPIDLDYPKERFEYMQKDSGTKIILSEGRDFNCQLSMNKETPSAAVFSNPQPETRNSQLAYIIYTSGSTGKPKGVMVEHSGVVNILTALQRRYSLEAFDTYLLKTSYVFDVSVTELFGWFLGGGRIVILEKGGEKDPGKILKTIQDEWVTHINFVPSMFNMLVEGLNPVNIGKLSSLKYIFLAGEALLPELVNKFRRLDTGIHLENIYGPTEGTIYSSRYSLSGWQGKGSIPIGKPLQNIRLYILDKDDLLQPIGIPGELGIAGVGLARGYLNNPELTAEKFDQDLWDLQDYQDEKQKVPGKRIYSHMSYRSYKSYISKKIYKTGDLALWLGDGNIEFLGRMDHQVKIRGFRVESGEIENHLLNHVDIKEAVVIAKEDAQEETHLCAYIVSAKELTTLALREYLSKKLPSYMIPAHFVQVEKIPLTPSGKVNRQALLSSGIVLETGREYVSPGSDIEKKLVEIWSEVLGMDYLSIGIHDNFFDIGGNSFSLIRLNSRLKEGFKKDIPMVALFNYPTIWSLARYLSGETGERTEVRKETGKGGIEIAVIGMSGRFPGAKTIDEFQANLKNGVESITYLTGEELEQMGVEEELSENPAFVSAKGRLQDIEYFDSLFFGYTPLEAAIMDPQMRIFHECCWEALENAGYASEMYDRDIGLYAGASPNPFWEIMPLIPGADKAHLNTQQWEAIQFSDKDFLSTRISYKLNLTGPGVTLQTACSTSLAAVILACQGLVSGGCDMALAGGVSVTLHDHKGYVYQEGGIMSKDGHCRAFDAGASGTVGGNGAGVVVLKRLADAISDGDTINAVIKGFAINNDGRNKAGFTAPSVAGQVRVIQKAQRMAGVDHESIGYVETHGTGTLLGDPIEIEALKQAFNFKSSNKRNYCALGSVKTNIGHLDAAAGIASFIKTVLALMHRIIPTALHFETPNPGIDFENSPFYVNTVLKEWKSNGYPLRAGVSSFGIGGTNAHVVLEEWPGSHSSNAWSIPGGTPIKDHGAWSQGRGGVAPPSNWQQYHLFLLSARTPTALDKMTENLAEYFKKNPLNRGHLENSRNPGPTLADAAYTLQTGRKVFTHRRMFVCKDSPGALEVLTSCGLDETDKVKTFHTKTESPFIVFMFPGQGAQYVNMGRGLYQAEQVFREEMDRCFEILNGLLDYDIKEILYPFSGSNRSKRSYTSYKSYKSHINQTEIAQPLIFIIEYALARLLMKWGIKPYSMIGHSIGEYTAACLSGVFSLEDALKLVVLRGKLMQSLPGGSMLSVPLAEEELIPLLDEELSLAAINSTSLCVVSGPHEAVKALARRLKEKGCNSRLLYTSHAFHSKMMEPILKEFEEKAGEVTGSPAMIPYISNVTGQWIGIKEAPAPGYWARQIRATVRFDDGITQLVKKENSLFVEVGPGGTLGTFVTHNKNIKPGQKTISLIRHPKEEVPDTYYLLRQIGHLWLYGAAIDWRGFYGQEKKHRFRIPLPTYPFEGKPYPLESYLFKWQNQPVTTSPPGKKSNIAEWLYVPSWKLSSFASHREGHTQSLLTSPADYQWLVFINDGLLGLQLVERLNRHHQAVTIVKVGNEWSRLGDEGYTINPHRNSDYHALLEELRSTNRIFNRVLHLWNVTENIDQGKQGRFEEVDHALDMGFYSLIYLAQAIGKQGLSKKNAMEITIVTNRMQAVTGEEVPDPLKAVIRGPVQVIPREYPHISCRSIDIDYPLPASANNDRYQIKLLENILETIETPIKTDSDSPGIYIAYRNNRQWVRTYEQAPQEMTGQEVPVLKEKGVYLVTGGLGGIGLVLAEYLAKTVKAHLVLTGRTLFPGRDQWDEWLISHDLTDETAVKIRKIRELEASGAEVSIFCADAANMEQMQHAAARIEERFGKINGIIHAARVPDGSLIHTRTREMSEAVFAPKIKGTLVLDALFCRRSKENQPDFMVLCSSISSVLSPGGQVAYCAANAFLDTLAFQKAAANTNYTVSINWDNWQEKGMAAKAMENLTASPTGTTGKAPGESRHFFLKNGILPAQGVEVFKRILANRKWPQVVVSTTDLFDRIRESRAPSPVFFPDELLKGTSILQNPRPELTTRYVAPKNETQQILAQIWQQFLGFQPIGIYDDFFELGGDSLKAMTLSTKIHKALGVEIPLTEFFNRNTIKKLAQYIRGSTSKDYYDFIAPVEEKEYYMLSPAQKRMYVLNQLIRESTVYNTFSVMVLEGEPDMKRFNEITKKLISRHESLRTSIQVVEEEPVQRIHHEPTFEIESYDLAAGDRSAAHLSLSSVIRDLSSEFIRFFDLSRAPLLRVGLIRLHTTPLTGLPVQEGNTEGKYILMVDMHHIISDGLSQNVLIRDFAALYTGQGLQPLPIQYKDFSGWQDNEKRKGILKNQEKFWLKQLEGKIPLLEMPTDFSRPKIHCFEGSTIIFKVDRVLTGQLRKLNSEAGSTLHIVLLTVFYILLFRYTEQEDIIVGTPIAGRTYPDLENIIGMFVNMLAIRSHPVENKTFREFLTEVKENALRAYENQDYPFEELIEKLDLQREPGRHPLIDVVFLSQNMGIPNVEIPGLKLTHYDVERSIAHFDLMLTAIENNDTMDLKLEYSTALFSPLTAGRISKQYIEIIRQAAENQDIKLKDITITYDLLSAAPGILHNDKDFGF